MRFELREIASKAAGTYFIVTDNSSVPEIEQTSNLRLFFINSENGPVNTAVFFKQGAIAGFENIFGKRNRKQEKQGNYSIKTCLEALKTSSIFVVNLRKFEDKSDKSDIFGLSASNSEQETKSVPYTALFNKDGLWKQESENIIEKLSNKHYLNFGNIGSSNIAIFVTVAKKSEYETLTQEGENTLTQTKLEIDEYPALVADDSLKVKDTMVTVWVFNNQFDTATVTTNRYYGNLFNSTGLISTDDLERLSKIPESGFVSKMTGSLIPNLKSEFGDEISINDVVNAKYGSTGLICSINTDLLELESLQDRPVINHNLQDVYQDDFSLKSTGLYLSHRLQAITAQAFDGTQDLSTVVKANTALKINIKYLKDENEITENTHKTLIKLTDFGGFELDFGAGSIFKSNEEKNKLVLPTVFGLKVGSTILVKTTDGKSIWLTVQKLLDHQDVTKTHPTQTDHKYITELATYEFNGLIPDTVQKIVWYKGLKETNSLVTFTNLKAYVKRAEQFTDGTATRQKEILDLMLSPSIKKGFKSLDGVRYLVDCFKSFIEVGYKYQFGELCYYLDKEANKFVRAIVNEPFIKDMARSSNPLFKQSADDVFDLSYVATGGNEQLSTKFLTKFEKGGEMCYFFGSVLDTDGKTEIPSAVYISNKFIAKTYPWDVIANETGYLQINGIPLNPDDNERRALEKFHSNPIIKNKKGFTVFGNETGQLKRTSLSQIHNSELLAYIKESLYNMARDEHFKKGTYNEYLQTEVKVKDFMDSLALQNAIEANPVVQCNFENNTKDIAKQKIKLIYIEYTNINALDKIVFDLNIN